jgi:hypothetical protein
MTSRVIAVLLLLIFAPSVTRAIEPSCAVAPIKPDPKRANYFTPEQEVYLGEILADWNGDTARIVDDSALNSYLKKIGSRLVAHLPKTDLDFRFYVYDAPVANAYSIAGGRVYVTRKLIGFTRNEDELAAVMAHELGHIVTHQMAYDFSQLFKKQIGVTTFTDRKDLIEKFHLMLESDKPGTLSGGEQEEADRVGAQILVRAGYRPEAMSEFFDRFTANKGRRGSWLADFFSSNAFASKRYREMIKQLAPVPAECIDKREATSASDYTTWRDTVVAYDGQRRPAHLPGLTAKRALEPPLQDQLHTLRFSPDGKFVLAQDNGNIHVLSREPFAVKFSIPAENAFPARFSADSTLITFYTPELRVEQWSIASGAPVAIYDLHSARGCMQTALSSDAHTLACIDAKQALVLIDTATQDRIFEKKEVRSGSVDFGANYSSYSYQVEYANLGFSPDGKYLLLSCRDATLAVEVAARKEIPLPGSIKALLKYAFTFLDDQRLFGLQDRSGNNATIVSFPEGKPLKTLTFGTGIPSPVTKGDFVLMRPIKDYDVGVVDINSGQIVRANKWAAIDIYGDIAVSELGTGEIALFGATTTPLARARLPRGQMAGIRVSWVGDDLQWLALAGETRGAIWNLNTGQRVYNVKSFKGAYFDGDSAYVDFPKQEKVERAIARLNLQQAGIGLANKLGAGRFRQYGPVVLFWPKKHKADEEEDDTDSKQRFDRYRYEGTTFNWEDVYVAPDENETLEVRDSRTGKILWTRKFDKRVPRLYVNTEAGLITYAWRLYMPGAKAELEKFGELAKKRSAFKDGDYFVEVADLLTGAPVGSALIDTKDGVFTIGSMVATRNFIAAYDSFGRTLVYNLKTGECTGKTFGSPGEMASDTSDLFVREDSRHFTLFDAATMKRKGDYEFPFSVKELRMTSKGDRILAVTTDQTVYVMNNTPQADTNDAGAAK